MSEMSQFLYTIKPTRLDMLSAGPTPRETDIVSRHSKYLEGLMERGVVLLAGRTQTTDESSFGIVILQAETEDAAQAVMENDPAVKHGIMHARLFPYRIALMASNR